MSKEDKEEDKDTKKDFWHGWTPEQIKKLKLESTRPRCSHDPFIPCKSCEYELVKWNHKHGSNWEECGLDAEDYWFGRKCLLKLTKETREKLFKGHGCIPCCGCADCKREFLLKQAEYDRWMSSMSIFGKST